MTERRKGAGRRVETRPPFGRTASLFLAMILVTLGLLGSALISGAPALATGSGDFCGPGHYLTPSQECVHQYDTYKELESWSTYGENRPSCVGITKEPEGNVWLTWSCLSTGNKPYDETYCQAACNGYSGYGMVQNASANYAGYFTGWGYWN